MGGNLQILLYIYIQHLFYYIVPMNMQQFACIPLLLSSYALYTYLVLRSSQVILPTELNDSTVDETVRKISNLCPMVEYLDYLDGFYINKSLCKLMQQLKKEMIIDIQYIFLLPAAATCFPRPPAARIRGSGGGDLSRRIAATAASCGPASALSRA